MLTWLLGPGQFLAHEYCYRQNAAMINLHFWSDLLIGLAYVAISGTLLYLVQQGRREFPFQWMFLAFGVFIIACGGTHFMEIWTLWSPLYWLSGGVKALTAAASVTTAILLPPLVPKTLRLIRDANLSGQRGLELVSINAALEKEIAERRHAEEAARKMAEDLEERVRLRTAELERANEMLMERAAIVQHSQDAIYSRAMDGTVTNWNPAAEHIFGYTADEIVGRNLDSPLIPPDKVNEYSEICRRIEAGDQVPSFETQRMRKDGSRIDLYVTMSAVRDTAGNLRGLSVIARDITDRKRGEEQLRQVQKLESLGVIAGGVAHDFNNLLVGIMGNASLVLESLPPASPNHALLQLVVNASEKAAHLTQQLLAYAGKGRFLSEKVDLSALTTEISALIQTSIPRNVTLRMELEQNLPAVEADPGQLQQVIMNLVINGAEAIGDNPGTVLVATGIQHVDQAYLLHNFAGDAIQPGPYVTIEVHDTGCGMDEEVRSRIFDPFYTTKFTGRGLGLSAVMGIVRSHHGTIRVYSEPGRGSTFKILLPAVIGKPKPAQAVLFDQELRGSGVVLVVDDEEVVRSAARGALTRYGYTVLTAEDGESGVRIFRERANEIALVLLDMTMPVVSGAEAFRLIRGIRPDAKVIVSSGYNEVEAIRRFTAKGIAAFIQKPYTAAGLARVVKQALTGTVGLAEG